MKMFRNKSKVSTAALLLVLTASSLAASLPVSGLEIVASVAYLYATPEPIGVNQLWLIEAWVTPRPLFPGQVYYNYVFVFEKPSGATESVTIPESEQTGSCWFNWIPDEAGTWEVTFSWAGDVNRTACSVTHELHVQEDPIPGYPDTPIPIDQPLTWPINPNNRLFTQIAGGWFDGEYNASETNCNPYCLAPGSSHVLWRIPPYSGMAGYIGVTTSPTVTTGYYPSTTPGFRPTYTSMSASSISISCVMCGRGFSTWGGEIHCYDVRTGEELWHIPGSYDSGKMEVMGGFFGGVNPILIDIGNSYLRKYNAITGEMTLDVDFPDGFPGGGSYVDPYVYVIHNIGNGTRRFIAWDTSGSTSNMWNRVVANHTYTPSSQPEFFDPVPYDDEIILPNYRAIADLGTLGWSVTDAFARINRGATYDNIWVCTTYPIYGPSYAINCTDGKVIWMHNIYEIGERNAIGTGYGVFYVPVAIEGMQRWVGFDVLKGNQKYIMDVGTYPFGAFFAYSSSAGYGMIWSSSYDGHIYGWDKDTGKLKTRAFIGNAWPGETPYGAGGMGNDTWCVYSGAKLGGGKVYGATGEWGTPTPYYRDSCMFGADVYTGERLWQLLGYWSIDSIAEGLLFADNRWDGYSYAIGKGPSSTTVSVMSANVDKGDTVWITGKVIDESPALKGQPCLSNTEGGNGPQNGGSLSAWQEYLFWQQPEPMDRVGVPVSVFAVSENGTVIDLGQTKSNGNGDFVLEWTPTDEDFYYITAQFPGDESYYSSWDVTSVAVGPEPAEPAEVEPPETPVETDYTPMFAGIIAAVAVVAVLLVINIFLTRRRK